jgi:hypothetical protein
MSKKVRPVFETRDYENNLVILSKETWRAKAGNHEPGSHPEIRSYLIEVQRTIERPDLVFQSTRDARSRIFYALNVGRGLLIGKHLAVVVKYVQEASRLSGYVSTMYLSRSLYSQGALLWTSSANSNQRLK